MNINEFFRNLHAEKKEVFASKAGTTVNYLNVHLFPASGKTKKMPSVDLMARIVVATNGVCSIDDIINYFIKEQLQKAVGKLM